MNFIEVCDVSKDYSGHRALNHVNLEVSKGSVYGLLGPNGAGKTSLIRIINQITYPDSGEILFDGRKMKREDVRLIGYLPEERGLYKKMKVGDQIVYLARLKGLKRKEAELCMEDWLKRFDLLDWKNKPLEALSKGMAQKVQFIATVIHRPPLLIFDEPFSGFDPVNAEQLKREIINLQREGATILFSTHNMASVEEVCQDITLIDHSEVVLQGNVNEIRRQHKKNIYRLSIAEGLFEEKDSDNFTIKSITSNYCGGCDIEIQLSPDAKVRDIIAVLNDKYMLTGFQEILPSMQEVFIDTVSGHMDEKLNVTD